MSKRLILLPLLAAAAPAMAQPATPADVERVLTDPATLDRLAGTAQALSKALLDLPVGEVEAAIEGRPASPAERRITVRDVAARGDKNFDRNLARQIANARPQIERSMKALGTALPAITRSLEQASDAIERAAANMPDPTYPRR